MAVTHYNLFEGQFFSLKGVEYTIIFNSKYRTSGTGDIPMTTNENRPITFGSAELVYDTSEQEKFSPLITSKFEMVIEILPDSFGDVVEKMVKLLRDKWEEGDVNIIVKRNGKLFWSGIVLIDLGEIEDTVKPYSVKLTAVDGLGLLKNYDMVKVQAAQPYNAADTYLGDGYQNIVYWLNEILHKCRLPQSNEAGGNTLVFWTLNVSTNWYYQDQNLSNSDCPPLYIKIQMLGAMKLQEGGLYNCPTAYDVLLTICKMFNCRLVYWGGAFYFTDVSLFNNPETGTTSPNNIQTFQFEDDGTPTGDNPFIGSLSGFGNYSQPISFGNTGGLQRLSGGNFTYQPKVKRVECMFDSFVGNEAYYQGFPPPFTQAEWNSTGVNVIHSTSLGTHLNASTFSGFICKFPVDWTMTNPSQVNAITLTNFSIRARPSSGGAWQKYLKLVPATQASLFGSWENYPSTTPLFDTDPLSQGGINPNWWDMAGFVPYIATSTPNAPQAGLNSDMMLFNEIIKTDSAFVGSWDFEIFTFGFGANIVNSSINGYFFMGAEASSVGAPQYYAPIQPWGANGVVNTWVDSMDTTVNPPTYKGLFQPYSYTASGASSILTQIYSARTDTEIKEVKPIIWGDTVTPGESNSIIWMDLSGNSGYTDPNGYWGVGASGVFNQTLTEMICQERLNNMAFSSLKMNCTIAASNKNQIGAFGKELVVNPIGVLEDANDGIVYQFQRGTYQLNTDEVEGEWMQVSRTIVASTTTNNGGGQTPTGPGPSQSARMGNPFAAPPAINSMARLSSTVSAGHINSLPIHAFSSLNEAGLLKSGDKFNVLAWNTMWEFELSADLVAGDTTIHIVPLLIHIDIPQGSSVSYSERNMLKQYMRKTEGEVAGFTISPSTITKNGIGISSWFNDPTFTAATHTTLPTSQAVKEYVLSKKNIIEDKLMKVNNDVINKSAFLHDDGLRFTRISDGAETGQINYDGVDKLTFNSNGGSSTGATRLDFQVNSGSKMVIDNEGDVGIGTTSPVEKLHILSSTNTVARFETSLTSDMAIELKNSQGSMFFGLGGGEEFAICTDADLNGPNSKFVVKPSGNVGIGTTTPSQKLHVKDGFIQVSGTGPSGYGYLLNRAGQDIYAIRHLDSGLTISNETDSRKEMTFNGTGNVGIGISSPKNKLDIVGSLGRGIPVTKTANFTVAATENWLIVNGLATITITLPTASSFTGRELMIKNIAAYTVISASSNVKPIDTDTAATAILPAIAGSWCALVSDGSDWVTMMNG